MVPSTRRRQDDAMDDVGDGSRPGAGARQWMRDAERDEVIADLRTHLEAGRLTPEEYENRSVVASKALMWADVAPLFADLPEPRPEPVATILALAAPTLDEKQGLIGMPRRTRQTILAVLPWVLLVLLVLTRSWLVVLLIPVAVVLVGAGSVGQTWNQARYGSRRR
jgi:hypothetical protein